MGQTTFLGSGAPRGAFGCSEPGSLSPAIPARSVQPPSGHTGHCTAAAGL